jgi:hypothetical protein
VFQAPSEDFMKLRILSVLLPGLLLSATAAEAHIRLEFPAPRHPGNNPPLKASPCGVANEQKPTAAPSAANTFRPGQTIMLRFNEFIGHPGHFRIALVPSGQTFPEPTGFNDIKNPPVAPILLDGVLPHTDSPSNTVRQVMVTLPNMTCTNCTLQLIQMMTDKPPFSPSPPAGTGNDIYYTCADIALLDQGGASDGGVRDGGPRDGRRPDGGGLRDARLPDTRPPGAGGAGGAGGAAGTGGAAPAGAGGAGGSTGGAPAPAPGGNESGGFCSIGGRDQRPVFALAFAGLLGAFLWRNRRRRR